MALRQVRFSPDPQSLADLITRKTGTPVRWDAALAQFTTRDGDVYCLGDLEDAARGMADWPDFTGEVPDYGE